MLKKYGKIRYSLLIFVLMIIVSIVGNILSIEEMIVKKIIQFLGGVLLPISLLLFAFRKFNDEKKQMVFKTKSEEIIYFSGFYIFSIAIFFVLVFGIINII